MLNAFRRGRRSDPIEAHLSDYPRFIAAWGAGIFVGLFVIVPTITVAGPLLYLAGRLRDATSRTLVDSASPR